MTSVVENCTYCKRLLARTPESERRQERKFHGCVPSSRVECMYHTVRTVLKVTVQNTAPTALHPPHEPNAQKQREKCERRDKKAAHPHHLPPSSSCPRSYLSPRSLLYSNVTFDCGEAKVLWILLKPWHQTMERTWDV